MCPLRQRGALTAEGDDQDLGIYHPGEDGYKVYSESAGTHLQDRVDPVEQDGIYGYSEAKEVVGYGSCTMLESLE